jgi:hypothetical protein
VDLDDFEDIIIRP